MRLSSLGSIFDDSGCRIDSYKLTFWGWSSMIDSFKSTDCLCCLGELVDEILNETVSGITAVVVCILIGSDSIVTGSYGIISYKYY